MTWGVNVENQQTGEEIRDDGPTDSVSGTAEYNWLFARLPPWVTDTMSNEQREAIHQAITDADGRAPPVNIRASLPMMGRNFFVTIVAGEEMRSAARRAHERTRYPLRTVANIFFFIGVATLFYMMALAGLAIHSAIVEF